MHNTSRKVWSSGEAVKALHSEEEVNAACEYVKAHDYLEGEPGELSDEQVAAMSVQLLAHKVSREEAKKVLVRLAHQRSWQSVIVLRQYVTQPDHGLGHFARLALDESQLWAVPIAR